MYVRARERSCSFSPTLCCMWCVCVRVSGWGEGVTSGTAATFHGSRTGCGGGALCVFGGPGQCRET